MTEPNIKEIVKQLQQGRDNDALWPDGWSRAMNCEAVGELMKKAASALLSLAGGREGAIDIGGASEAGWRKVANERLAERDEARRVSAHTSLLHAQALDRGTRSEAARLLAEKQLAEAVGVLRAAQRAMEPALKGYRRSDEEDDWRECVVCHGWIDHCGHSPGCALVAADVGLRAFLAQHQSPQSSKGEADG